MKIFMLFILFGIGLFPSHSQAQKSEKYRVEQDLIDLAPLSPDLDWFTPPIGRGPNLASDGQLEQLYVYLQNGAIHIDYAFSERDATFDSLRLLGIERAGEQLFVNEERLWQPSGTSLVIDNTDINDNIRFTGPGTTFRFRKLTHRFFRNDQLLRRDSYYFRERPPHLFKWDKSYADLANIIGTGGLISGGVVLVSAISKNKESVELHDHYRDQTDKGTADDIYNEAYKLRKDSRQERNIAIALIGGGASLLIYGITQKRIRAGRHKKFRESKKIAPFFNVGTRGGGQATTEVGLIWQF